MRTSRLGRVCGDEVMHRLLTWEYYWRRRTFHRDRLTKTRNDRQTRREMQSRKPLPCVFPGSPLPLTEIDARLSGNYTLTLPVAAPLVFLCARVTGTHD